MPSNVIVNSATMSPYNELGALWVDTSLTPNVLNICTGLVPTTYAPVGTGAVPGSHTHAESDVTSLTSDLAAKAPNTPDYLVGTAQGGLSAEIVVGTTPGGELGGTWGTPSVDASHSGSTHAATQTAAEATAAAALATHEADTTAVHGIANTANLVLTNDARLSIARSFMLMGA